MSEDKTEGTEEERSAFFDAIQKRYEEIGNVLWQKEYDDADPEESKELWRILTGLAAVTQAAAGMINLLGETKLVSKEDATLLQVAHQSVVEGIQTALVAAAEKANANDA